jgi:hypothetical protein
VGHPLDLLPQRRVERGVPVPVDVAPQRADAVEVTPALDVEQVDALGALDDQGVGAGPVGLGREGVPEMALSQARNVSAEAMGMESILKISPRRTRRGRPRESKTMGLSSD